MATITQTLTAYTGSIPDRATMSQGQLDTASKAFHDYWSSAAPEINTFSTQANALRADVLALQLAAQSARDNARLDANAATAAEAAIDQALDTVSGETASTVAHAADLDAHPTIQERFAVLINAAQDLAGQSAREALRLGAQLSDAEQAIADGEQALIDHDTQAPSDSPHAELVSALEAIATQALQLAAQASRAISGGRIALTGGNAAIPALILGANAGLYQSAAGTLSVVINGTEVARFSASGLAVTGGTVSSL